MNIFYIVVAVVGLIIFFTTRSTAVFPIMIAFILIGGWLFEIRPQHRREDVIRGSQNMLEYVRDHRRELGESKGLRHPGLPEDAAIALTHVNMRSRPSTSASVVTVLSPGDRVVIENHLGQDGWFRVSTREARGWVYGRYLRPQLHSERVRGGAKGIALAFRFMFPESSFWKKLLGWFIGLIIGFVVHVIARENEGPSYFLFAVPFMYFLFKNRLTMGYTPGEMFIFVLSVTILTALTQVLIAWLVEQARY